MRSGNKGKRALAAFFAGLFILCLDTPSRAENPSQRAVITDSLGRKVSVPGRVRRIISLQPETTRIIIALGSGDRLVGVDYFMLKQDPLFPVIFPPGRNLPAVSNTPEDMNFETVMKLEPDVIFVSPTERQMVDALQVKTGRPVVAISSMGSFDQLIKEVKLLGRLLDQKERALALTSSFRRRVEAIIRKTSSLSTAEKPRIYLSFWGALARTPIAYEPVDAAGGINCAAGILPAHAGTINTVIQIEKLIEWKPDIILVQGNYRPGERAVTVEGILGDKRLGSVPAVKMRRVFYTFGFWYWWDPAEVLVETIYLAGLFHPDLFESFDLEREGNEIFREFYGVENAFTILCRVLGCGSWNVE
jgi:iron complex transport system substrate-binding protein